MSYSYQIVTARPVTRAQLRQFVRDIGGTDDSSGIGEGEFRTSNHGAIFIAWDPEDEAHALEWYDSQPPDEVIVRERAELVRKIEILTDKLGAPPCTYVQMDVLENRYSERVALRFIRAFQKRWDPCVLKIPKPLGTAESGKEIWTIAELLAFSGSYGGLPH